MLGCTGFRSRGRWCGLAASAAVLATVTLSAAEAKDLPEPSDNPAVMQHGGEEDAEGPLQQKLRRAWDLISGRY